MAVVDSVVAPAGIVLMLAALTAVKAECVAVAGVLSIVEESQLLLEFSASVDFEANYLVVEDMALLDLVDSTWAAAAYDAAAVVVVMMFVVGVVDAANEDVVVDGAAAAAVVVVAAATAAAVAVPSSWSYYYYFERRTSSALSLP